MKELKLVPRMVKSEKKYSSYKGNVGKVAKNILARNFDVKEPDRVWASDVTEFKTDEGKVYLSPIKDFCTGEIISYRLRSYLFFLTALPGCDTVRECQPWLMIA